MSVKQRWPEEQRRVDEVISIVEERLEVVEGQVGTLRSEIVSIRNTFWDDVTVNLEDADELIETYASMKQQAEVMSERERNHRHALRQLKSLLRLKQTPYFGRIDFLEDGERDHSSIYIGTSSLMDNSGFDFLVYDWRAPVSSLYYDYGPGPARYTTPGGEISGMMELKRQFIIRDGRIRSLFDTGVTIGDELLQEVLGKQSDAQMRSIVATIQREQNRIIRNETARLLVVQGAAGSGKTSAALQRVAYLLYRYRETLKAEQIVLFSPNPMFNSYVSTVLPELGEENMQQTTFQQYLDHRLGREFAVEDPFGQMEYTLSAMSEPGYEARVAGIQYKASAVFLRLLDRYAGYLSERGMVFRDVVFRDRVLVSGEQLKEQFYTLSGLMTIPNRMVALSEWLLKELRRLAKKEMNEAWVLDEIELLDKETYQEALEQLHKKKTFSADTFDDFDREQEQLSMMVVQEKFKVLRKRAKKLTFIDAPAVYRQLFSNPELASLLAGEEPLLERWDDICSDTAERLDRKELSYEDATPYLYLVERLEGFQTNNSVRHVFIDEAQDYSAFQFAVLKRLFPRARMTVLGDLNQAIYAHAASENGFAALQQLFEAEETETIMLTRSYRSTREIVEFTRGLVEGGEAIELFNRGGSKPTLTQAEDTGALHRQITERIGQLQKEGHRSIAVICKTAGESREAFAALQEEIPSLHLISTGTGTFEKGVVVIPSYLAKGVEFDAVLLYDVSRERYGHESERRLFYTACTRAMHELHLLYTGELTPLMNNADPQTYEVR
ncbi:RNA polymerase recycling motor HelD [Paenibacillus oceani]|uniref:UvrD-helicase domain-containing protein n=1 Tax=Paenibacillus oceani TaxID=2772510 RepID=A0A927CHP8_9BACL|nr:RNA polymerase recycling motor HelD [Paenibacillus oceani]MBD2866406.1 UvrD-helicase domain-containing protein [Paenibacillus oceani]